jgi:hypothetical protein
MLFWISQSETIPEADFLIRVNSKRNKHIPLYNYQTNRYIYWKKFIQQKANHI